MKLLDALKWRYATKRMNGKKVSDEKLNNVLEAIRLAATSLGLQPFRVIVVENMELRKLIHEKACPQPQIIEGSHVLIFASLNAISDSYVTSYINLVAQERGVASSQLSDFKAMIDGFLSSSSNDKVSTWATHQAYIALGFGLVAAALEHVDSTPMEGFNSTEMDRILGLAEKGLHSVALLTLGYRDEMADYLANAKKVRLPKDELFTIIR